MLAPPAQVVEPKPHVREKTFEVCKKRWVGKTPEISREFLFFQAKQLRLTEFSEEYSTLAMLDEGAILDELAHKKTMDHWFPVAQEEEAALEWARVLVHGSSTCEQMDIVLGIKYECTSMEHMAGMLVGWPDACIKYIEDMLAKDPDARVKNMQQVLGEGPSVCIEQRRNYWEDCVLSLGLCDGARPCRRFPLDRGEEECDYDSEGNENFYFCHRYNRLYCYDKGYGVEYWYENDDEDDEVRISANAVKGGGIRRKQLTPAQLKRKIARNAARLEDFNNSLVSRDPERPLREEFVCLVRDGDDDDDFYNGSNLLAKRLLNDPVKEVELEPSSKGSKEYRFYCVDHDDLFVQVEDGPSLKTKRARTSTNMNPLSGYTVRSELDADFRRFVAERDAKKAQEAKKARKDTIAAERSQPLRQGGDLEALFDAVADAFAESLRRGMRAHACYTVQLYATRMIGFSC